MTFLVSQSDISRLHTQNDINELRGLALFIRDAGNELFPRVKIATPTAQILFFRFYAKKTVREWNPEILAMSTLFLAGKLTDCPHHSDAVIAVSTRMLRNNEIKRPRVTKENAEAMKEHPFFCYQKELFRYERAILDTLHYNLSIDFPFSHVTVFMKKMPKISDFKLEPIYDLIIRFALKFVNDSFTSFINVLYSPKYVAAASIYMSSHFYKIDVHQMDWWKDYEPQMSLIKRVCDDIHDLYEHSNTENRYGKANRSYPSPLTKATLSKENQKVEKKPSITDNEMREQKQRTNSENECRESKQKANSENELRESKQKSNSENELKVLKQRTNSDEFRELKQRTNTDNENREIKPKEKSESEMNESKQRSSSHHEKRRRNDENFYHRDREEKRLRTERTETKTQKERSSSNRDNKWLANEKKEESVGQKVIEEEKEEGEV